MFQTTLSYLWKSISFAKKERCFSKLKKVFKDDILNYYFENLRWEFWFKKKIGLLFDIVVLILI